MKKYIIYIGILAVGLLLGRFLFGGPSAKKMEHHHTEVTEKKQMWTCSMHPQIMQPEPGDCPICGMELIPAQSDHNGLLANQFKLTENAMALANVQTTRVGRHTVDGTVRLSGQIAENEEANTVQVSYFSGRIERLNVNFIGEKVQKGQALATIYSPELYAAQQELITASSLKESQPALYRAVRNKLKLWKLSENQIDEIETSGKVLENFAVYATVSGTVSEKLVDQGDYVKQGQPLLKIANLNTVWANFDVYENQIDLFKKGQEVFITARAYPNKKFKGKVDFIDPVLNAKTRTVVLRVVLNNSTHIFKPGMFVEGKIVGTVAEKEVLTIPSSAVLWTGKRSVVYVKTNPHEPIFEMREITLGNKIGEAYQVREGLNNGDEIVTHGTFTIDAAAQLQGKKSMMNKEDGKTMADHKDPMEMEHVTTGMTHGYENRNRRVAVSKHFQKQLQTVFDDYIALKDALIQEDSKKVSESAKRVLHSLSRVDMKLLRDTNVHRHWMALEKEIKTAATSILDTLDIKVQRNYFKPLSSYMANALEVFGINKKVYHQFCPMADNNKGAYWLSLDAKVVNPYFGKAMISCGEVKQVIE